MSVHQGGSNLCICGKSFLNDGTLLRHQSTCGEHAANLTALTRTFSSQRRKRRRKEGDTEPIAQGSSIRSTSFVSANPLEGASLVDSDLSGLGYQADQTHEELPLPLTNHPPTPPLVSMDEHGRPIRENRGILPARYRDAMPEGPTPLPEGDDPAFFEIHLPEDEALGEPIASAPRVIRTAPNSFGLIREYIGQLPLTDPERELQPEDLLQSSHYTADDVRLPTDPETQPPSEFLIESAIPGATAVGPIVPDLEEQQPYFAPYPNQSVFDLDTWYWRQPQKSMEDFRRLTNIITSPTFKPLDIDGVNWTALHRDLGSSSSPNFDNRSAWKKSSVTISVPSTQGVPLPFSVEGILHKSLVQVIIARCESPKSKRYHYVPHQLLWRPNGSTREQQVFGELYNSPAWIEEDAKLQNSPREPGCTLPRSIVALMLWSDSTHLTDFGTASLWPMYIQFGNESKYPRGQPSQNSFVHLAYIQSLPKSILEFIHLTQGKPATPQMQAHCKRELIHAILKLLLDDEFRHAYVHGIVVLCSDGIRRRLYPRFFSYSADYPEKVLLATIRDMGSCPCPRCLVPRDKMYRLGMPDDRLQRTQGSRIDNLERRLKVASARNLIYNSGKVVNSVAVEAILKPESLVPTENAFSALADLGLDFHRLLLPDILHEWEIGNIQRSVKHIVRILYAHGRASVATFDQRFDQVPSFGSDSIRSFGPSVSEFSKFAARNYSDVLVCILPVIENLLPEPHNSVILDWLFIMNFIYALAKLRLHTTDTVDLLDAVVIEFGKHSRKFKKVTCSAFRTTDLPKEAAARVRRRAKAAKQGTATALSGVVAPEPTPVSTAATHEFNLNTYKFHSVGDLSLAIRTIGTLDSVTTQLGEVEHKRSKSGRYDRTSKKDFESQLASMDIRDQRLQEMEYQRQAIQTNAGDDGQDLQKSSLIDAHHFIGRGQKSHLHIGTWLHDHAADRAAQEFFSRLKDHLLARLDSIPHNGREDIFSFSDHSNLEILNDRMYSHQTFRINYTTYDVRRAQDVVKASGPHRDIMMLSGGPDAGSSPFCYARVLGIFHVNVMDKRKPQQSPERMEFLFVRWFTEEVGATSGWAHLRLPHVKFVPQNELHAFGFVDPLLVIRAAHLIPAFSQGRTGALLGYSRLARGPNDINDFAAFYINWFADRDMFMRHLGGGVGHVNMPRADPRLAYPPVHPEVYLSSNASMEIEDQNSEGEEEEEEGEPGEPEAVLRSYSTL